MQRHNDRAHKQHDCLAGYPAAGRCLNVQLQQRADTRRTPPEVTHTKCKIKSYVQPSGHSLKAMIIGVMLHLVMDSGCTWHCHPTRSDLINFKPRHEVMVGIDGGRCEVTGMGDLPVVSKDDQGNHINLVIRDVRCVPSFTDTLLSVNQFQGVS